MMNLSMSHPVPTFGDSFTITCYVCGMPSSKEWAQKARSRPTTPMKPYFPFLLQITPIGGALLREDGSTYLCAFCHASLEAQWNIYESQQVIPPPNRKYNIQKFICAVCGVETYRKRIRALPFQEFPFLEKQRQPGSITLGNNPLAIVCLDCSETLWAQSAEYDRWGLPVHKRHFNWMARPPPPEDSVEATVARLPSGETQLPRCPPIEPTIAPSKVNVEPSTSSAMKSLDSHASSKVRGSRGSGNKGDSPKLVESHSHHPPHNFSSPTPQTSGRKTSLTSTTPPSIEMAGGFHSQQPPIIVTVAPMSSHTTVISLRKDSLSLPSGLIASHQTAPGGIFHPPSTAVYPPAASYAPYVWGNTTREPTQRQSQIEAYPYTTQGAAAAGDAIPPGAWPWLSHPTTDLLRYQSYVTSLQNRSRMVESSASASPTHTPSGPSSSPSYVGGGGGTPERPTEPSARYQSASSSAPTSTVTSGALREHDRNILEEQRQVAAINSERRTGTSGNFEADNMPYHLSKGSPDPNKSTAAGGKKSPKISLLPHHHLYATAAERPASTSTTSSGGGGAGKPYHVHPKKLKESSESSSSLIRARNSSSSSGAQTTGESEQKSLTAAAQGSPEAITSTIVDDAATTNEESEQDKVVRRDCHIPKKRNWHVFMKESQSSSAPATSVEDPSKSPQQQTLLVHHPKKKKSSLSECSSDGGGSGATTKETSHSHMEGGSSTTAMDLSVTVGEPSDSLLTSTTSAHHHHPKALTKGGGAGAKFRIEYLCQSTSNQQEDETEGVGSIDDGSSGSKRTSVIRCAPKVPPTLADNTSSQSIVNSEDEEDNVSGGVSKIPEGEEKEESFTEAVDAMEVDRKNEDDKNVESLEKENSSGKDNKEGEFGGGDDGKKNEQGKSEKQVLLQEESTMFTDDEDDKNEDLPNIEQFIKETVLELVSQEKERHKMSQKTGNDQREFLDKLGLITPDKKIDLELKSIVSRHERQTLPPLQLRPETKLGRKIGKQLKELLLKVSLQDPTLFDDTPEAEKADFMAELGMKTAQRSEKTRREVKWRVILMERMRRELRNVAARGVKHEWEKSEILKKFANCDLDSFFNSLSYSALQASEEELQQLVEQSKKSATGKSAGESGGADEGKNIKEEKDDNVCVGGVAAAGGGMCINYPKYIPSYVAATSSNSTDLDGEDNKTSSVNNENNIAPPPTSTTATTFAEPILKIPVVPPKRRLQSESSTGSSISSTTAAATVTSASSDTDESELGIETDKNSGVVGGGTTSATVSTLPVNFSLGVPSGPYPLRIDNLIQNSTSYWQQMKRSIDEILDDLESQKEDVPLEDKTVNLNKLRKHLKSQLSDIKEIEKRFRATGKAIMNTSRNQKKSQQQQKSKDN